MDSKVKGEEQLNWHKANALKNVVIPRYTEEIRNISDSLDEKEREEFSRMKVIKTQKEG